MTEFFNKKEEILEVQLTPHGRDLLSKGLLKPSHYAFFDDEVLYDTNCAGYSEPQNSSLRRIKFDTPSLKVIPSVIGAETRVQEVINQVQEDIAGVASDTAAYKAAFKQEPFASKSRMAANPLGTSQMSSLYDPAWNIGALANKFDSTKNHYEINKGPGRSVEFGKNGSPYHELTIGPSGSYASSMWNTLIGGVGAAALPFSWSVWINARSPGVFRLDEDPRRSMILSFGAQMEHSGLNRRTALYYDKSAGKLVFIRRGVTTGAYGKVMSDISIGMDRWYHVVATFAGGATGAMTLYINATDATNVQRVVSNPGLLSTGKVGNHKSTEGGSVAQWEGWDGYIDELSIWDKVLSAAEITELYNNGKYSNVGKHSAIANCLAWWRMGSSNNAVFSGDPGTPRIRMLRDKINQYPMYTPGAQMNTAPFAALKAISGSYVPGITQRIPQLNVTIDYQTYYKQGEITGDQAISNYLTEDNIYLNLQENYLVLEVGEQNTEYEKENFDIEVYYISSSGAPTVFANPLQQLGYINYPSVEADRDFLSDIMPEEMKDVEYYMNILVDNELPAEVIQSLGITDSLTPHHSDRLRLSRDLYQTDPEEPCD